MTSAAILAIFLSVEIKNDIPKGMLTALCWVESKHHANAIHVDDGTSNSVGICQIQSPTSRFLGFKGKAKDLFCPRVNITLAGQYLKYQYKRYGNWTQALTAYNYGNAKNKRVSGYFIKVMKSWEMQEWNSSAAIKSR